MAALWSGPSLTLGVLKEPPKLSRTRGERPAIASDGSSGYQEIIVAKFRSD